MKNTIAVVAALVMVGQVATGHAQPPKEGDKPAAAAPAAGQPPPSVPKPPPENDVIKKSAGSWTCEATGKGPDGQDMKYKSTWAIKPVLGGHWYTIVYKRSKMGPMPAFEGNATVGFNTATKKYVFVGFDNFGSWIDLKSDDGSVYTGDGGPMGKVTPVKFTFGPGKDKKGEPSDKLFDAVLEFGTAASNETCKK
jgi:hypothetical protein